MAYYRDNKGLEVDAVIELPDGRWAGFEVTLGGDQAIDAASGALARLAQRIDRTRMGEPAALAVIVATGYGYRRKEGIAVVPVGTLGP